MNTSTTYFSKIKDVNVSSVDEAMKIAQAEDYLWITTTKPEKSEVFFVPSVIAMLSGGTVILYYLNEPQST